MNRKKIFIIYAVVIAVSILLPIGLQEFIFKNNFYSPVSNGEWASFFGSYIGGIVGALATMTVFVWTVHDNKISREEEHRLQVIPCLTYEIEKVKKCMGDIQCERMLSKNSFTTNRLKFDLIVKNVGLGSAQEINLKCWNINNNKIFSYPNSNVLLQGQEIRYRIALDFPDEEDYDDAVGLKINFSRDIEYKDVLGNLYYQEIPLELFWLKYYENGSNEKTERVTVQVKNIEMAKCLKESK